MTTLAASDSTSRSWQKFLLDNPDAFLSHYFPHALETGLKQFHLDLIQTAISTHRGLVLFPAAHGKTTIVSTLLPIWALCRDPNVRIVIIGKNENEAQAIMQVIQSELMGNEMLVRDFGPFRPDPDSGKPWALGRLSIHHRTRRHKSPTIAVFGSGNKTILGHRSDWVVCDDVVTPENSSTPEARAKLREWFNQRVETSPEYPTSRITVVGTRFHPNDLYGDLIELSDPETGLSLWDTDRQDAIVDAENQRTLWPERWPWRLLMQQKAKMGTLDFNKRYRNIAVDASRMMFKEEYVRGGFIGKEEYRGCLDRNYRLGEFDDTWRRASGFDPAIGVQRHAKFCAHVTLGMGSCKDHDKCLWVVDLVRDQMSLPQQVDTILGQHAKYRLGASLVEANAYQKGLYDAVQAKQQELGFGFRIDPHYTSRTNKPDPEIGVGALSPWVEQGRVHIPWSDPHSRRVMGVLVDELVEYPSGRTTDTVMALWMAWRGLDDATPRYQVGNYLKKPMAWDRHRSRRTITNPFYARDDHEGSR